MKITKYYQVEALNSSRLDGYVNDKISEGWQPFGSPLIHQNPGASEEFHYIQAMVKYESSEWDDEDSEENDITESKDYLKRVADELRARNDALLKNYEILMKQKLAAFDEIHQLKKEIALLNAELKTRKEAHSFQIATRDICEKLYENNEIYEKVIKDFISHYSRRDCEAKEINIMLNDYIYTCGLKLDAVNELFNKIITKYKMDKANENN